MLIHGTVAGITFRNQGESFTTMRPSGMLQVKPEPDNEYDPNAIGLWYGDVQVGYIKRDSYAQQFIKDYPEITEIEIDGYAYATGKGKDLEFNDNHEGRLTSIKYVIDNSVDDGCIMNEDNQYMIDGEPYDRLTGVLSYANLEPENSGLDRWKTSVGADGAFNAMLDAFDTRPTRDEMVAEWAKHSPYIHYKGELNRLADKGTEMHNAIELFLRGDDSKMELIPEGFHNFWAKFEPEVLDIEMQVVDHSLHVAGRFDLQCMIKGKKVVVDWKSNKKATKKNKVQVGCYTAMSGSDEGWILSLGSETKQGFSLSKVTGQKIADSFNILKCASAIKEMS